MKSGIRYNDPDLNIDWQIPADKALISEKDLMLPDFNPAVKDFIYPTRCLIPIPYRVAVTGSNGQLGKELARIAGESSAVSVYIFIPGAFSLWTIPKK